MIINFTVGNYFSIKDKFTLSFVGKKQDSSHPTSLIQYKDTNILKSIAIFGPNASGKSTLIRAFAVARSFILNGLKQSLNELIPVEPFVLNTVSKNKPSFFELELLIDKKRFIYGFETTQKSVIREWLHEYPNKKILFERSFQEIKSNPRYFKESSSLAIKNTRENVLFLTVLASLNGIISSSIVNKINKIQVIKGFERNITLDYTFEKYSQDNFYRDRIKEILFQGDVGIDEIIPEETKMTDEEVEKYVDASIRTSLATEVGSFMHRKLATVHKQFDAKGNNVGNIAFNFFKESDGTQQLFALSGPIIHSLEEGNILIIDEIDSSLHPFICRYILKLFNSKKDNKNNSQLIFTSHDISLLDEDILRRDQIWFTEKNKYGATQVFSLADLGERSKLNYEKRYLEGRYGAIPYVKLLEEME